MDHAKPRVVISKCLNLAACRWNGEMVEFPLVEKLPPHVDLIPVCPECGIGLEVPRQPVRLVEEGEDINLVQPSTGKNLTLALQGFQEEFLSRLGRVEGFILKSKSPTCGVCDVNIYRSATAEKPEHKGKGIFAAAAAKKFPDLPYEHENRLVEPEFLDHFLTRIFTLAGLRRAHEEEGAGGLAEFLNRNRLLINIYNPGSWPELTYLATNTKNGEEAGALVRVEAELNSAMAKPPERIQVINALTKLADDLKQGLSHVEKAGFWDLLQRYKSGLAKCSDLRELLIEWAPRFKPDLLAEQTFLYPYPKGLTG